MFPRISRFIIPFAILCLVNSVAQATLNVIQPTAVSTNMGSANPAATWDISHIISNNAAGFDPAFGAGPYTSGVTDFADYTSDVLGGTGGRHVTGADVWLSQTSPAGSTITFDMGSIIPLEGIAIWNAGTSSGDGMGNSVSNGILSFDLFADADGVLGGGVLIGSFTTMAFNNAYAEDFTFAPTSTRYVVMDITARANPLRAGLAEVVFASTVPEPTALVLISLLGTLAIRRRRRPVAIG